MSGLSNLSEAELCASCRDVTLSMLMTGFQRYLDYDQTQAAKDQGCRLCGLAMDAYVNQVCIKSGCDKTHHGPLLWRVADTGPGVRNGMFKLDYRHFGPSLGVSVPEGAFNGSWLFFVPRALRRELTRPTSIYRIEPIPRGHHHTQGIPGGRLFAQYSPSPQLA